MIHPFVSALFLSFLLPFHTAATASPDRGAQRRVGYEIGEGVGVSCLNRTIETGEHISDSNGHLQYIPFPTCAETNKPLTLPYGLNHDLNCTIAAITDPFFHLLEFYIHNDVPLTCRIPSHPSSSSSSSSISPDAGDDDGYFIPLTFALSGKLQLSHLHVGHFLNVLVHGVEGVLDSAIAYSVSGGGRSQKVIIGEDLGLRVSVRWVEGMGWPGGKERGVGAERLVWCCLLSALVTLLLSTAYFRGHEFPKRLRRYNRPLHQDAGDGGWRGGHAYGDGGVGANGYGGYGVGGAGSGYGYEYGGGGGSGWGKRD